MRVEDLASRALQEASRALAAQNAVDDFKILSKKIKKSEGITRSKLASEFSEGRGLDAEAGSDFTDDAISSFDSEASDENFYNEARDSPQRDENVELGSEVQESDTQQAQQAEDGDEEDIGELPFLPISVDSSSVDDNAADLHVESGPVMNWAAAQELIDVLEKRVITAQPTAVQPAAVSTDLVVTTGLAAALSAGADKIRQDTLLLQEANDASQKILQEQLQKQIDEVDRFEKDVDKLINSQSQKPISPPAKPASAAPLEKIIPSSKVSFGVHGAKPVQPFNYQHIVESGRIVAKNGRKIRSRRSAMQTKQNAAKSLSKVKQSRALRKLARPRYKSGAMFTLFKRDRALSAPANVHNPLIKLSLDGETFSEESVEDSLTDSAEFSDPTSSQVDAVPPPVYRFISTSKSEVIDANSGETNDVNSQSDQNAASDDSLLTVEPLPLPLALQVHVEQALQHGLRGTSPSATTQDVTDDANDYTTADEYTTNEITSSADDNDGIITQQPTAVDAIEEAQEKYEELDFDQFDVQDIAQDIMHAKSYPESPTQTLREFLAWSPEHDKDEEESKTNSDPDDGQLVLSADSEALDELQEGVQAHEESQAAANSVYESVHEHDDVAVDAPVDEPVSEPPKEVTFDDQVKVAKKAKPKFRTQLFDDFYAAPPIIATPVVKPPPSKKDLSKSIDEMFISTKIVKEDGVDYAHVMVSSTTESNDDDERETESESSSVDSMFSDGGDMSPGAVIDSHEDGEWQV